MLTRKQEFELITALTGRGEIPLKFAYLGDGAKNWDRIASNRSSDGVNLLEWNLLQQKVTMFLQSCDTSHGINLIDIGCGNGIPVFPIIEELIKAHVDFSYVPVDISYSMLDLASQNIYRKFGNHITIKPIQLDYELGSFSDIIYDLKQDSRTNLLAFLGTTLGNHEDRQRVLSNFRDSMGASDFLLIGVELTNFSKIDNFLPYYLGEDSKRFLYFIPQHLGIDRNDTEHIVQWNAQKHQIESKMLLKKRFSLCIGGYDVALDAGEQILFGVSVKFSEWTITKLLSDVGFRTELLCTSNDRGYLMTLVQPTRYKQ